MIRPTCALQHVLRSLRVPARLYTEPAYRSRAKRAKGVPVALRPVMESLPNAPKPRMIFNAILGHVAQDHPQRLSDLNARNAFYAHLAMHLLPLILGEQHWAQLMILYMDHTHIQSATVTEREPLVALLLNIISGGVSNLSSQKKAQRISKFRALMKSRKIRLSISALHAVCFAGDLSGAGIFLDDTFEVCGCMSNKSEQLEVAQRVYAHLIGTSFVRRNYSVVLRLYGEMEQLNLASNSARTYGHVIRSLCMVTMFSVQRDTRENAVSTIEQSLQSIRALLDDMLQAQIPVTPRLVSILMREFSAMMQYVAKYGVSVDLARDLFMALTTIRKTDNEVGSIAMLELAWAEVLLDIRESQSEDCRSFSSLPYIDGSTGFWSYDAVLDRIVRRSWLSRRNGAIRIPRTSYYYYGRGISTTVIECHRLQILMRDRLVSNDPATALEHYKALRDMTDTFHISAKGFLASVSLSSHPPPLHSLNGIISSPDTLIASTARDLSLRLHGTYARLLNYTLGKHPPPPEETATTYSFLIEVLRQGAPMRKRSFPNFHRAWQYTMKAILTWRLPWDAMGSRLGMRAAFDILNFAYSNGVPSDDDTKVRERDAIRSLLAGKVAWHVARVALKWVQEQEVSRLQWSESVDALLTTFRLFEIKFTAAELSKLDADANWVPNGRRLGVSVRQGPHAREVFKDVMAR